MSADPTAPDRAPARADLTYLRRRTSPARATVREQASAGSLDLSAATPRVPPPTTRKTRPAVRVASGERVLLGPAMPMVTLNRLQSGVGSLVFEALCSSEVGDLRLGCAYTLADGHSSTTRHAGGSGPNRAGNPVALGTQRQSERFTVDLRQNRRLTRLIAYGFSERGRTLRWGGTLVVTTLGGARIVLPIDRPASGGVAVFLSVYNVDGELVLRAETDHVDGDVREACQAYGFDQLTWVDGRTSVS